MTSLTPDNVLELLRQQEGRDQALSAREVVETITLQRSTQHQERQLRRVVMALRDEGWPICAQPPHGYWWAKSAEELNAICAYHLARARASLRQIGRLKKRGIPMLVGQMLLPIEEAELQIPDEIPESYQGTQTIAALVELPEDLWALAQGLLREHEGLEPSRLLELALAVYLQQRGVTAASKCYLRAMRAEMKRRETDE